MGDNRRGGRGIVGGEGEGVRYKEDKGREGDSRRRGV